MLNENKKDFALKNAIITVSVGIFSISTLVNMILANINTTYSKFIVNWKKKLQKISLKDMNEWIKWRKNKYSLQWWWNYYFILLPLIFIVENIRFIWYYIIFQYFWCCLDFCWLTAASVRAYKKLMIRAKNIYTFDQILFTFTYCLDECCMFGVNS